ncbi:MAG: zf-HC2 domain-containing protein [Elusimicrobiota bacterium]
MRHEDVRDLLDVFRDGELDPDAQSEVSSHLESCPFCREENSRRRALALAVFPSVQTPDAGQTEVFVRAVMSKIPPEPIIRADWKKSWRMGVEWWLIPSLGLALAALIASLRLSEPSAVVSIDSQILMGSRGRRVTEMVLPPDPARSGDLLAFEEER